MSKTRTDILFVIAFVALCIICYGGFTFTYSALSKPVSPEKIITPQ